MSLALNQYHDLIMKMVINFLSLTGGPKEEIAGSALWPPAFCRTLPVRTSGSENREGSPFFESNAAFRKRKIVFIKFFTTARGRSVQHLRLAVTALPTEIYEVPSGLIGRASRPLLTGKNCSGSFISFSAIN